MLFYRIRLFFCFLSASLQWCLSLSWNLNCDMLLYDGTLWEIQKNRKFVAMTFLCIQRQSRAGFYHTVLHVLFNVVLIKSKLQESNYWNGIQQILNTLHKALFCKGISCTNFWTACDAKRETFALLCRYTHSGCNCNVLTVSIGMKCAKQKHFSNCSCYA